MSELIAKCVQEEEKQKPDNKDQVNLFGQGKNRNHGDPKSRKKLNFLKAKKHDFKNTKTANTEGSANTNGSTKGPKCHFYNNFGHI